MTTCRTALRDRRRASSVPARGRRATPRWSSATRSRCAGSRVPVLPAGQRPAAGAAPVRPAPDCPGSAARSRGCAPLAEPRARPRRQHRRQPGPPRRRARRCCDALEPLLERPGAFVLGSNDYFAPGRRTRPLPAPRERTPRRTRPPRLPYRRDLVEGLTRRRLGRPDQRRAPRLTVAGHDVELRRRRRPAPRLRPLRPRWPGPAAPGGALTIGVVHAPYQRVLDAMAADGAGLVLAGHTHGGQLCLPVLGALVTNCDLDRGRAKGVSRWWPGAGRRPGPPRRPADAAWLRGLRRARHLAVRAGAVRLPAGGDPADPHRALTGPSGRTTSCREPASRRQPTPETSACGHEVDRMPGRHGPDWGLGRWLGYPRCLAALGRGAGVATGCGAAW